MKKIFFVALALIVGSIAFANESNKESASGPLFNQASDTNYELVQNYLKKNFSSASLKFKNPQNVSNNIQSLTLDQRLQLFEERSKSGALYFGLNFLFPGLGSFIQGDKFGGTVSLLGVGAGMGLLFGGYVYAAVQYFQFALNASEQEGFDTNHFLQILSSSAALFISGAIVIAAAEIFSYIRPFVFSSKLNNELKKMLNVSNAEISVAPVIAPASKDCGVTAALKISL